MTDHKFTDDDVIKALECCLNGNVNKIQVEVCSPCPFFHDGNCTDLLKQNALAIINRQKAEIERLESLCEKIGIANDAKFERICVLQEDLETAKSEAVKEFAERLKADIVETGDEHGLGNSYPVLTHNYIDTLVKEMTEVQAEAEEDQQ